MEHRDLTLLREGCEALGLALTERQEAQFLSYYEYLTEKNKVMNLTAITEFEEVVRKHFIDSLSLVKVCDLKEGGTLIDVGTGAGFPGIPLKIAFPQLDVVLLDSLNKRVHFLNETIDLLGLQRITAIHGRAEDVARNKDYREKFDLCVSRAVANLASLSEYCLPFVKQNGAFISYKSIKIDSEIRDAEKAIRLLGGKLENRKEFYLPGSDLGRSFLMIRKVHGTPARYPRKAGMPSKEPLV